MNVVIIGSGNVASALGRGLAGKGVNILQVYGRNALRTKKLSTELRANYTTSISKIIPAADIYIVALKDSVVKEFVSQLKFIPSLIVHTSGTLDLNLFPGAFPATGVIYPVQTITRETTADLATIPFCIEANNATALKAIRKFLSVITDRFFPVSTEDRRYIHLAAVFANNFTNHLFVTAFEILKKKKLAASILYPLIDETCSRALNGNSFALQTGPARRNDKQIIDTHLKMLKEDKNLSAIYRAITRNITDSYSN